MLCKHLCESVFTFLEYILRSEIAEDMVPLCLTLEKLPASFPKLLYHFTFSPVAYEDSNFFLILANTCYYLSFYYNHPSECGVVSHQGSDLPFSGG